MSISNLFENNDYALKCRDLTVTGDTIYNGDLIENAELITNADLELQGGLIAFGGSKGSVDNILTSAGPGVAPVWRINLNTTYLSSGSTDLVTGQFIGMGFTSNFNYFTYSLVSQPITIITFGVRTIVAPGVGNSYSFELFKNSIATGHIATISDLQTTASSPTFNLPMSQYQTYSLKCTITGPAPLTKCSACISYFP